MPPSTVTGGAESRSASRLKLENGSRVGVIGGGPAGSFFSYFLLQMAERVGLDLKLDIYEPRAFDCPGPRGCNMCGGIVSESLMQNLATEGIHLPAGVVQRRIDSYFLHMDVGSVRIATPRQEMRIAAVARGSGPRGSPHALESFDAFLLDLAEKRGARRVKQRVSGIELVEGRPRIETLDKSAEAYDLVVGAVGVNSKALKTFEDLGSYKAPRRTKAYVAEFPLGQAMIERYLSNSMHVFLLNLPRLEFAALIPKSDFVTVVLLGEEIDNALVQAFLGSKEVKEVLPPQWQIPKNFCHCSPKLNVDTAVHTFGDRVVFVGDCGTTRLFKDGIGAAFRTAKAAARTAVFSGIAASDFRRSYWPACRSIHSDNRLGKFVFSVTREVQKRRWARKGIWRMTSREQWLDGSKRRMSRVLWDTFTGSAPYKSVLMRSMHPAFLGRLGWELAAGVRSGVQAQPKENVALATGRTGQMGKAYEAGDVIYEQGDHGDSMLILCGGRAEVTRRVGDQDFTLPEFEDGDFFGEMAVFGKKIRTKTVRALDDVAIISLKKDELMLRVHEDPAMAFRLIERMAHRIAGVEHSMIEQGGLPTEPWELAPAQASGETVAGVVAAGETEVAGLMGRKYGAGEVVYHQSDHGDCMYVICGGEVETVRRDGEQEFHLPILRDGDFFGEQALFGSDLRPATVRAIHEAHILTVERNSLLRQVHEDPSMAFRLIERMATRIAGLEAVICTEPAAADGHALHTQRTS